MKTILKWTACAACAVWTGTSASAATETVTGQNVIGLTTIENDSRAYLPLAAAYTGTGATELTVSNVVQTATLAEGDELYAYDPERKRKQYDVYTLGKDGKWTAVKTVEVSASGKATETTSPAAADRVITCGRGFWIVRKGAASDAKPVRLVGDVPATAATVTIPAAVDGKPSATLIGVPSDWKLNETDKIENAAKGDKIRVLNEDGKAWREIVYDGTKWIEGVQKVGENGAVTFEKNENPVLKGGYAVWYMRAGKSSFTLELPKLPR